MKYLQILLLSFTVLFLSCNNSAKNYSLYINDSVFQVELAASPEERREGLMHRQSLAADHGMLFIFEKSEKIAFWMRNTYIDLSIAYIAADGTIIDILDMKALDETAVESSEPVKYALEVNRGALEGVYPGDKVDFRDIPLP